jgi:O-antigen/teichoic acid export membrane protein
MRQLILSGGARFVGLLPQAIATLVASRLILDHYGLHSFNTYALVIALMALIPLNNLGVGASVTQAIAAYGATADRSVRSCLTAARVLTLSASALAVLTVGIALLDLWPTLLGDASGANWFTALALVVFAATFVPGLAPSVLLGANRNHVSIAVGSFLAPISLVIVIGLVQADLGSGWVMVVPPLALLVMSVMTMVVGSRLVGFPWLRVLRQVPWRDRFPGARIRALSGPMLITSLCVPITFCTDRIVLSHVSTEDAVANYSVVLQLCAPIIALIVAAAQPLWPMFTQARTQGEVGPNLNKIFLAFGAGTLVCGVALVALADPIGHLIGGDRIDLGYFLPVVAALVMLLLAVAYPLSMSVIDPAGARFVATCAVLALPTNILLSIWLSREFGAPGPLLSLLVVSTTVQVIPILVYSRRRERSGRPIVVVEPEESRGAEALGTAR